MSIAAVDWAFKQTVGASTLKFLLVAMANYADETGICYPSVRRLTEDTEQDRKTIITNIAELEKLKLLTDTNERCGMTKRVPVYRLLIPKKEQSHKRNSSENGIVPKTEGNSPVFPIKQSRKRDTDPSGTVSEQSEGGKPPLPQSAAQPSKRVSKSKEILLSQSLNRICYRLKELEEADMPTAVQERKELRAEKQRILKVLDLKA